MKQFQVLIGFIVTGFFYSCSNHFDAVNSESYPENVVTIDQAINSHVKQEFFLHDSVQNPLTSEVEELIIQVEKLKADPSDQLWDSIEEEWRKIGKAAFSDGSGYNYADFIRKWTDLNIALLKVSGKVQFGDELEKLFYQSPHPALTENQLKSVIYTHVDDHIFINISGPSAVIHHHTTGGNVKLIQQTNFPESNEITLKVEAGDVRFLDVFVRIPAWAGNPTVQLGNVKYVAHPGEYCEISRKWKNGDQIDIKLKN